jgi:uncharacterized protein
MTPEVCHLPSLPVAGPPDISPASYALETIHGIINSAQILHVSFNPPNSPFPVILPLIGQMGSFARPSADLGDVLELYLHGYVSSRIINLSRSEAHAQEGLPVCVAASHVDGLVLALTPNSHSYNYRSAVLFGYATLVEDVDERLYAMALITNSVVPNRWQNSRIPPNNAEMQSTSILRVKISAGSAKIRTGPPSDEKHDKENQEVVGKVWSGVLPCHMTMGDPIAGPYNQVELPPYLSEFVTDFNNDAEELSVKAANTAMGKKSKADDS